MKKPSQTSDDHSNFASAVLRVTLAAADKLNHSHRQHFVSMRSGHSPTGEDRPADQDAGRFAVPWEDSSSGEGAASALESLRKLEQSRNYAQPADDRPAAK